jgi:hypothetical protein
MPTIGVPMIEPMLKAAIETGAMNELAIARGGLQVVEARDVVTSQRCDFRARTCQRSVMGAIARPRRRRCRRL